MKYSDSFSFLVLVVLYFMQGTILTIFTATLPMILIKSYSISQLSYLNFTSYPFALKIFFAPFLDAYYNKKFGQRKSYIVPMNYIAGIVFVLSSFVITDWMKSGYIIMLAALGLFLVFVIALQDIATDAWGIKIMSKENFSYVSLSQAIGMQLSFIFANTVYIQMKFDEQTFFYYFGIFMIVFNLIVHFLIDEYGFNEEKKQQEIKEDEEEEKQQLIAQPDNKVNNQSSGVENKKKKKKDIKVIIQTMKGFYFNEYLRTLIILVMIQNVGIGPLMSTFTLKIQKAGITKEKLSMSQFYQLPIKFLMNFIVAKYFKNSLKVSHVILISMLGLQLIQFSFYQAQTFSLFNEIEYIQIGLLVFIQLFESLVITSMIQTRTTFYSSIATKGYEGIYITMLTSFQNLARKWVVSSFQFFDDYLNFNYSVPILWAFQLFYIYYSEKEFKKMDKLDKKKWCLVETMESKQANDAKKSQ
ncbi:hypothetical protein ABPG72_017453 [Tetrahymena utriculariae]